MCILLLFEDGIGVITQPCNCFAEAVMNEDKKSCILASSASWLVWMKNLIRGNSTTKTWKCTRHWKFTRLRHWKLYALLKNACSIEKCTRHWKMHVALNNARGIKNAHGIKKCTWHQKMHAALKNALIIEKSKRHWKMHTALKNACGIEKSTRHWKTTLKCTRHRKMHAHWRSP